MQAISLIRIWFPSSLLPNVTFGDGREVVDYRGISGYSQEDECFAGANASILQLGLDYYYEFSVSL